VQIAFHHICIQTNNYYASKDFYVNMLGFEVYKETAGFHNRDFNTWLKLDNMFIELQTGKNKEVLALDNQKSEGIVHFAMFVEDLDSLINKMVQNGYSFKKKNGENKYFVENGYLAKVIAPEGTIIELRDVWEL